MRIAGKHATSLVDGKGVNYTLFTQGCEHHCKNCQNPSTWDKDGGVEMSLDEIKEDIMSYVPPVTGVTFSGGDPVMQANEVVKLAKWAKENGLITTLYTGYTMKELVGLINLTPFDYVIDGEYMDEKRSYDTPFRGSSNQMMYKNCGDHFEVV